MRSVVFADEKVVDLLNQSFILCWNNHAPDLRKGGEGNEQPVFSKEELELYPEGAGGGNVRGILCKPDGAMIHYIQGWYRPERYVTELKFALELSRSKNPLADHQARRGAILSERRVLEEKHPGEMEKPFEKSPIRRLDAALNLLAESHLSAEQLLDKPVAAFLEEVREENKSGGVIS